MIVLPKKKKLEGDALTDARIITVMKRNGCYNCRFVKTLSNGARLYQMMDANDKPISAIWENVEGEKWVRVQKGASKNEDELVGIYELSKKSDEELATEIKATAKKPAAKKTTAKKATADKEEKAEKKPAAKKTAKKAADTEEKAEKKPAAKKTTKKTTQKDAE